MVLPKIVDGRNRLFFMFNWEGLRENKALTQTPSLPLTAWRTGDFSELRDASGNLIPIYDPATRCLRRRRQRAAGADGVSRQQHPGQSHSSGLAEAAGLFPAAEQQVTGPNFVNNEARQVNADQFTYRFDFSQGKSTWTFRHSISHELGYDPFAIPNMGINTDTDVQQLVFSNTRTFGSNKLNDVRFGFGYLKNGHISPRANNDNVVKALGINLPSDNPLYWGVPNIGITGLSGLGEESDAPFINDDKTIQFVDNFTWTVSKHSFKFGGEIRHVLYDQIGGVVTRGRFALRRPLYPEPAGAGGTARRRGVRRFPPRQLQPLGGAGRRADRQLPVELLRALRPGQLAARLERDDELRAALGIRPAVHRHRRRDRQHRLRLGQHARAGVRPRGHGRSV